MFHATAPSKGDLPTLLLTLAELALGGWVLFMGFRPRWLGDFVAICFMSFACVSAYHVLARHPSCGCFGGIRVNPAHSLAFDLAAVAGLWFTARASRAGARRHRYQAIFAVSLLVALACAAAIGSARRPMPLGPSREAAGLRRPILLRPADWVGQTFPLFDHVQGADALRDGTWIIVFHRRGCEDCRRALAYHGTRAAESRGRLRLASIEIIDRSNMSAGRLRDAGVALELGGPEEWVLETPAALLLRDGSVLQCLNPF